METQSAEVVYRPMAAGEEGLVREMIKDLYHDDQAEPFMTDAKIEHTFRQLQQHPDYGQVMVMEKGLEIIGYAILLNFWSNEYGGIILYIDELYIVPSYRSRGLGKHFIQFLKDKRPNECVALKLEVLPYNTRALKLYQQLGFEVQGRSHLLLDL
jgi:ribosomal protein S18 acetylase RimI-like enzyme